MAYRVFGNPITEEALKRMPKYANKTTITPTDMAQVALDMKNEVEAEVNEYIENLQKEECKCDVGVYTIGKICNATGHTATYSTKHDFSGELANTYPATIENGQCGVFKHEETYGKTSGSCGAVVYGSTNNKNGKACDWMFSWSNPTDHDNKVFTEIAERGHYPPDPEDPVWDHVLEQLSKSGTTSTCEWNGCTSYMKSTPSKDVKNLVVVEAKMALDDAKA